MKLLKIIFFLLISTAQSLANNDFFNQGLVLYQNDDLKKAKFKFEQDLVLNPLILSSQKIQKLSKQH